MKSKLLSVIALAGSVMLAGYMGNVYAQSNTSGKRTDAERKEYLEKQKKKIDAEAEKRADRARDNQKGLANSGATQKKVDQINKERDDRKKALDDHYKKGQGGKK